MIGNQKKKKILKLKKCYIILNRKDRLENHSLLRREDVRGSADILTYETRIVASMYCASPETSLSLWVRHSYWRHKVGHACIEYLIPTYNIIVFY